MSKYYSVRLQSLTLISEKCYKAVGFDGSEALIPVSQVHGQDYSVQKSEAYWISAWILERKNLQYSSKKWTIITKDGRNIGQIELDHHVPEKLELSKSEVDESLIK